MTTRDPDSASPAASRRTLLKSTAALAATATPVLAASRATARETPRQIAPDGDHLVMLGVDGGPVARPGRAKPALALVVQGRVYLVDCGYQTSDQLVASGLGFADLAHLFVTHHHLDHTSGIGGLVLHGWTAPGSALGELTLWGPPDMRQLVRGVEQGFRQEIDLFAGGGGFPPFPDLQARDVVVRPRHPKAPHEQQVRVMEDDLVTVHATRVFHGEEVHDAYAYRFTIKSSGKRVVFSGDTAAPDEALIALGRDADVIVHETQDNDNVEIVVQNAPPANRGPLRDHLLATHSDVRDLPRVGRAAGAGRIVFSHYTPLPQPASAYLTKAQRVADEIGYDGTLVAPEQLDVIRL